MTVLKAIGLSYTVDQRHLVHEASFALEPGSLTMLVGPNGAGKTTLLRLAIGLLEPSEGLAEIEGEAVAGLTAIQRARKIAYLPQQRPVVWPQPVRDIIALGRFAYGAAPGRLSDTDTAALDRAIALCDLEDLADRAADTLSGGELSRVHLARTLAAETPVMVADEPVSALDPRFQHDVMHIFRQAAEQGRALLTVVHDLSLAARYADRLIWMSEGTIVADGPPKETMTSANLRAIFGVEATVRTGPNGHVAVEVMGPAEVAG